MEEQYYECGDGWIPLIKEAEQLVEEYNKNNNTGEDPIKFVQIKEKWGGLRLYLNYYIGDLYEKIEAIENRSFNICEDCGTSKNVSTTEIYGWYSTLCPYCRSKRIKEHVSFFNNKEDHKEEFLDYPYLGIGEKPNTGGKGRASEEDLERSIF